MSVSPLPSLRSLLANISALPSACNATLMSVVSLYCWTHLQSEDDLRQASTMFALVPCLMAVKICRKSPQRSVKSPPITSEDERILSFRVVSIACEGVLPRQQLVRSVLKYLRKSSTFFDRARRCFSINYVKRYFKCTVDCSSSR